MERLREQTQELVKYVWNAVENRAVTVREYNDIVEKGIEQILQQEFKLSERMQISAAVRQSLGLQLLAGLLADYIAPDTMTLTLEQERDIQNRDSVREGVRGFLSDKRFTYEEEFSEALHAYLASSPLYQSVLQRSEIRAGLLEAELTGQYKPADLQRRTPPTKFQQINSTLASLKKRTTS